MSDPLVIIDPEINGRIKDMTLYFEKFDNDETLRDDMADAIFDEARAICERRKELME